jgi:hypothetical protein
MRLISWLRFRETNSRAALCVAISLLLSLIAPAKGSTRQQEGRPQADIGLEIRLSDELSRPIRLAGPRERVGSTVIPRRSSAMIFRSSLRINDLRAAGDLTAIQVEAEVEGDGIRVSLSIIYNDLSDHEWWKHRNEKAAGSYLIQAGDSVRPAELNQFGIEPFEMKAIDARPVVLKPGEGARITNSSTLVVEKLERHFDTYQIWLKNTSDKNIVAYQISSGRGSTQDGSGSYGRTGPVLAAGATSRELYLSDPEIEVNGIAVSLVVFEDGTFEGDSKLAVQYLAKAEGVRIQSPSVLRRIEQTLRVEDSDLIAAFVKLEAELWLIPEAMDKPSALLFLKTRFPDQNEKALSALYEVFKGGLYDGRNIALTELGDTLRRVREMEQSSQLASAVEAIRRTLERLVDTFGKITAPPR